MDIQARAWDQSRTWIQAAYDASTGDDPLVDWALLNACPKNHARCDRDRLLQRLMAVDEGNAELLLQVRDARERIARLVVARLDPRAQHVIQLPPHGLIRLPLDHVADRTRA